MRPSLAKLGSAWLGTWNVTSMRLSTIPRVAASVLAAVLLLSTGRASANAEGPPGGVTGAPLAAGGTESTCARGGCHTSFALNSGSGELRIILPASYVPGRTYEIVVDLIHIGQLRWGFELTALADDLLAAGSFVSDVDGLTQISMAGGREYIKHTLAGTAAGKLDGNQWAFDWGAPDTDVGPVTFYLAGNAASNSFGELNDYIYTVSTTVPEPGSHLLQIFACGVLCMLSRRESTRFAACSWALRGCPTPSLLGFESGCGSLESRKRKK